MFLRKHFKKKRKKKRTLTFQQNIYWHANSLSPYLFFTSPSTSLTEMQLCSQLSKLLTSSEHANVILISLYLRFECSCRIYWRNLENLNTLNNKASCIIWLSLPGRVSWFAINKICSPFSKPPFLQPFKPACLCVFTSFPLPTWKLTISFLTSGFHFVHSAYLHGY